MLWLIFTLFGSKYEAQRKEVFFCMIEQLSDEFQGYNIFRKKYIKSLPDAEIPTKFKISNYRCEFLPTGLIFMKQKKCYNC